jgi:hypothetical protein
MANALSPEVAQRAALAVEVTGAPWTATTTTTRGKATSAMTGHVRARQILAALPTYLRRDGNFMCTLCAGLVGSSPADQLKHTAWHTILTATLLPSDMQPDSDADPPSDEPEPSAGSNDW